MTLQPSSVSAVLRPINSKFGLFKTIRIGNMIRISRKSFEDWLKMQGLEENEI